MYRVPGESVIEMNGSFRETLDLSGVREGFILSTFTRDKYYVFDQGKEEGSLFLLEDNEQAVSHEEYLKAAAFFRDQIRARKLGKAVFSRIKRVSFSKNPRQLFFRLVELYPEAFVYLVSSPLFGTWLGATPEILLSVHDGRGTTMALAGTLPSDDEGIWGKKEMEEQVWVRDYIRNTLRAVGVSDMTESGRAEYVAGPVKHLVSHFEFSADNSVVRDLIVRLHPTPAVSGWPQKEAVELIAETETHQRSLYAGIIGYLGDSESRLYVNLRCARISPDAMSLFLGGGFTADSEPDKEWEETENKARTLLNVVEDL